MKYRFSIFIVISLALGFTFWRCSPIAHSVSKQRWNSGGSHFSPSNTLPATVLPSNSESGNASIGLSQSSSHTLWLGRDSWRSATQRAKFSNELVAVLSNDSSARSSDFAEFKSTHSVSIPLPDSNSIHDANTIWVLVALRNPEDETSQFLIDQEFVKVSVYSNQIKIEIPVSASFSLEDSIAGVSLVAGSDAEVRALFRQREI